MWPQRQSLGEAPWSHGKQRRGDASTSHGMPSPHQNPGRVSHTALRKNPSPTPDLGPSGSQNCVCINVLVSCHSACGPLSCLLPGYTWLPHISSLAFFLDISPEFSTACGTFWMFKMSMDGHLPCPGLHHMKPPSPAACRPQKQPLPFVGEQPHTC